MIGLCARLKDLNFVLQVHKMMFKTNVNFDLYVSTAIIDMYRKCGEISIARQIFDGWYTRNVCRMDNNSWLLNYKTGASRML